MKNFIDDLEAQIAYRGMRKNNSQKTDLMHHARHISDLVKGAAKVVELGTGRGQGFVTLCNSIRPGGFVYTIDIRNKNSDIVAELHKRYPTPNVHAHQLISDSASDDAVNTVMADGKVIDFLFIDSLHTRDRILQEIITWFPHLSSSSVVAFHDAIWCWDTVHQTCLDVLMGIPTKRVLRDPENIDKREHWPSLGHVGLGVDMRPTVQSDPEIYDASEEGKCSSFNIDDYSPDAQPTDPSIEWNMTLAWPGLITFRALGSDPWCKLQINAKKLYNDIHT